ncbi:MAG: carboxypeptidase M32 [Bacteroidia bacterium]|nr:carboxypeptidase M32 [Bacteroidia bacterium]MDW8134501.1 carboxypeptidase M32 [Bacteroidia bacterium]
MALVEKLKEELRTHALLSSVIELLTWDQEVCMPKAGVAHRAAVLGSLMGLLHQYLTERLIPSLREAQESNYFTEEERRSISILLEEFEPAEKIPPPLVQAFSEASSLAQGVWVEAREKADFELFAPHLEKLVKLAREKAEALGYEREPYEALLRLYERSISPAELERLFGEVRPFLMETIRLCHDRELEGLDGPPLQLSPSAQRQLVEEVLRQMGYDLSRGRIDVSAHPFCAGFNPDDVRLTIRIFEEDLTMALGSAMHEMGHALYEQGLQREPLGWPPTLSASLSIHESQSRFWENHVGNALSFWEYLYQKVFPKYQPAWLSSYTPLTLTRKVNRISPNLIRIQSDEVSYHLHILLRFELERGLINGELSVRDLPAAWNEKIYTYLGLEVPNNAKGVLQDIHWAMGNFGYFPTYSLGSFYAAQFAAAISREEPDWEKALSEGDATVPLQWMRKHIHQYGRLYDSQTLCQQATGEPLSVKYFTEYVRTKVAQLYEGLTVPI